MTGFAEMDVRVEALALALALALARGLARGVQVLEKPFTVETLTRSLVSRLVLVRMRLRGPLRTAHGARRTEGATEEASFTVVILREPEKTPSGAVDGHGRMEGGYRCCREFARSSLQTRRTRP